MQRRPWAWLAFVLTFLLPGLGHVYSGRFGRAFVVLLLACASYVLWFGLWALAAERAWLVWSIAGLGVLFGLAFATDAARAARGASGLPERVALRCASFFLMGSIAFMALRITTTTRWMFPSRVMGVSMQPGLRVGDFFWTDCRAFRTRAPERGELVTIQVAQEPTQGGFAALDRAGEQHVPVRLAKRIVGLPGDRVAMRQGTLFVNDVPVPLQLVAGPESERFEQRLDGHTFEVLHDAGRAGDFETSVEPDRYFVLGDNRNNSNDSRFWGTVPRADVVGRVTYLYFSWDAAAKRPRWERIGQAAR